jgi:amino acid transporter
MEMSNTFTPIQKYNRAEYINEKNSLAREEDYKPYAANECAFSVERKGSFKVIVLLLLLVICLPLLHVFYRDEPGIDFLATLVSVMAIRVFLVGPLNDFQLYKIDFLFAAAILLVGTVSLIKAMRANSRRELALKSGSSW